MNIIPISLARDEDAGNAIAVLERAAIRAPQIAVQTQTAILVVRNVLLNEELVSATR